MQVRFLTSDTPTAFWHVCVPRGIQFQAQILQTLANTLTNSGRAFSNPAAEYNGRGSAHRGEIKQYSVRITPK